MQCCVCRERYDTLIRLPTFMPCGHSLCGMCVLEPAMHACPYCRKALPSQRASLPRNYALLDLLSDPALSALWAPEKDMPLDAPAGVSAFAAASGATAGSTASAATAARGDAALSRSRSNAAEALSGAAASAAAAARQQSGGLLERQGSSVLLEGSAMERKSSAPPAAGAVDGAPTEVRLLSYVTLSSGYQRYADAADGPLEPGQIGVVVGDMRQQSPDPADMPCLVRPLQERREAAWWYYREALQAVPPDAVPPGLRVTFLTTARTLGTPVSPHTAAPLLFVQRGYDWLDESDKNGADGEIGQLIASSPDKLGWKVFWANGGEGVYYTGKDGKFELVHAQVHDLSGAPLQCCTELLPGMSVMRGQNWVWGPQDGEPYTIGSYQPYSQDGWVTVKWPYSSDNNYCCVTGRYDLCHALRGNEPATFFTAMEGVAVSRGRDWKYGKQDNNGGLGVLLRPVSCDAQGVWWAVRWSHGVGNYCVGGATGPHDLQYASFRGGDDGPMRIGTIVTLSASYKDKDDAKDGPLKPPSRLPGAGVGKSVGVVANCTPAADARGVDMYQVMHIRTHKMWWYRRDALQPLAGVVAAAQSWRLLKVNRAGRAAFHGTGDAVENGGDTGLPPSKLWYCGSLVGQCRCGRCDGRCGPDNGCPCHACLELAGLRVGPPNKEGADALSDAELAAVLQRLELEGAHGSGEEGVEGGGDGGGGGSGGGGSTAERARSDGGSASSDGGSASTCSSDGEGSCGGAGGEGRRRSTEA